MNALKNKVQLIGNIGLDPEVKTFDGGKKMARLRLVTNEKYKNASGELVNEATWHNLIAWGKTADIIEKYIEKGKEIASGYSWEKTAHLLWQSILKASR